MSDNYGNYTEKMLDWNKMSLNMTKNSPKIQVYLYFFLDHTPFPWDNSIGGKKPSPWNRLKITLLPYRSKKSVFFGRIKREILVVKELFMLNFVKSVFRRFFEALLWVNLILFAIMGGVIGNFIWHPIIGFITGLIMGMLINIVFGGTVATLINIDENIEYLFFNSNKPENNSNAAPSGINLNNITPVSPASNSGDSWVCKKCGDRNPASSSSCKGCGVYK